MSGELAPNELRRDTISVDTEFKPMELVITYDVRAPSFGAPARELYAAALDQVRWADDLGFDTVGLGEHHGSPDGYNPSPLVLASAFGGCTQRIRFHTSVLLAPL